MAQLEEPTTSQLEEPTTSKLPRPGLLDDHLDRPGLAADWHCSTRTIARYEQLPDGLPYVIIGGRKWYPIQAARDFMARRLRRPNPVRKAG